MGSQSLRHCLLDSFQDPIKSLVHDVATQQDLDCNRHARYVSSMGFGLQEAAWTECWEQLC